MKIVIDKKQFQEKLNKALAGIAWDVQEALKDKLNNGVDPTGKTNRKGRGLFQSHLKSSIKGRAEGNKVNFEMLDYGKDLEYGTPHTVTDVEHLKDWVKQKIFKNDPKVSENELMRVTEKVKKNIETKGSIPFPFIRYTFDTELIDIIKRNLKANFK